MLRGADYRLHEFLGFWNVADGEERSTGRDLTSLADVFI
jgi:hypothetical protein